MSDTIHHIEQEALQALAALTEAAALQAWKTKYLGTKGVIRDLLAQMSGLAAEERKPYGQAVNGLKNTLTAAVEAQEALIRQQVLARDLEQGEVDITLPGRPQPVGGLHPATGTLRQFYSIWADMGFSVFRSRDVEHDDYNFTRLNFPPDHPARDMQDTFYTTDPGVILRTHTSPGQIRAMEELGAAGTQPIRVILPGMCYRFEQITARSEVQFHQVEGLAVGRSIRMSDLKGTVTEFARRMFGQNAQVRFRASYFPFTEPSMEIDVECFLCGGKGCRICKYSGWLEIAAV
ncbi:MAG: phenylalanine--tRNA ligase subunit alpha, partial [Anaerolineae bacterium]|nr:phenylalanine--tRNA ligase subunit alpha [Anaerolineae bacterium]